MDKTTKVNIVHEDKCKPTLKMWDVKKKTSTKLGQEDSLGLGMRLTWKKT
jgi:hypothetical protein